MNNQNSKNPLCCFVSQTRRVLRLATLACLLPALGHAAEPIAVLRLPPLPVLTEKIMTVARAVQPGMQTETLPLMLFGAFGYPSFPGISTTENVSLFIFEGQQGAGSAMPAVVILANIAADSPARNAITSYKLHLQDREDDWTLIAMNPILFDSVDDVSALIKTAQSPKDYDIELMVEFDATRLQQWMTPFVEGVMGTSVDNFQGDDIDAEEMKTIIQQGSAFVQACLVNFNNAKLGMDIEAEELGIGFAMQAIAGTPEALVLSSPAGGKPTVAHYLPTDAMLVYTGKMSTQPWFDYIDVLQERLVTHVKHEKLAPLLEIVDEMKISMQPFSGEWANIIDITDLANNKTTAHYIYGGDFEEQAFVDAYERIFNERMPELLTLLGGDLGEAMKYTFSANKDLHQDMAIHQLSFAGDKSKFDAAATVPFANKDLFLALVDGNLLMTQSGSELKQLIDVVKSGKPVQHNIADKVNLEAGEAARYLVDLRRYAQMILGIMPNTSVEAKQAFEALTADELEPLSGQFSYIAGQARIEAKVPVTSLAKIAEALRSATPPPADQRENLSETDEKPNSTNSD